DGTAGGWSKENNRGANDWSGLDRAIRAVHEAAAAHFPGGDTTGGSPWLETGVTAAEYARLNEAAYLDQWARWLAVQTIVANSETNFSNGADDDYSIFVPAGGRAELVPHDLDTVF